VALFTSTGNVVIGVFHTLSAGKAGQLVPGNVGPTTRAEALVESGFDRVVALEIPCAATNTSPMTINEVRNRVKRKCSRRRLSATQPVYFVLTTRRA
jgi:hypothetical protein